MAKYNERGQQIPDQTPIEVPLGWKRPETLTEQIRRLIRVQMSAAAVEEGKETFAEANDFDCGEEDPEAYLTPYEVVGMSEEIPRDEHEADSRSRKGAGGSAEREGRAVREDESERGSDGVEGSDGEGTGDDGDVESDQRVKSSGDKGRGRSTANVQRKRKEVERDG